jgi:hypothetical protein
LDSGGFELDDLTLEEAKELLRECNPIVWQKWLCRAPTYGHPESEKSLRLIKLYNRMTELFGSGCYYHFDPASRTELGPDGQMHAKSEAAYVGTVKG